MKSLGTLRRGAQAVGLSALVSVGACRSVDNPDYLRADGAVEPDSRGTEPRRDGKASETPDTGGPDVLLVDASSAPDATTSDAPAAPSDVAAVCTPAAGLPYARRLAVSIPGGAGGVRAGTWISLTFDHAALVAQGWSRADGADVRVFDGATERRRFVDERSRWNDRATKVWFRTPRAIAAGATDGAHVVRFDWPAAPRPDDERPAAIVKAIHTGTARLASSPVRITVPAVVEDRTAVFFGGRFPRDASTNATRASARLLSSTTLELSRAGDDDVNFPMDVRYYVLELSNGGRVQRGVVAQTALTVSSSIATVAPERAFTLWSRFVKGNDPWEDADNAVSVRLVDPTHVEVGALDMVDEALVSWEIIELTHPDDVFVRRGVVTMPKGSRAVDVSLPPPTQPERRFVLADHTSSGSVFDRTSHIKSTALVDDKTLRFERDQASGDCALAIGWQAIDLQAASDVQTGVADFAVGVGSLRVPLSRPVAPARAVALGTEQRGAGQAGGRAADNGYSQGVCSVTIAVQADAVVLERGATGARCRVGFTVIEFPAAMAGAVAAPERACE